MSKWISIKERLPDLDQLVIITWLSDYDRSPIYAWGGRTDDGDGWRWGVADSYRSINSKGEPIEIDDNYPVTHWMPLPAPPEVP